MKPLLSAPLALALLVSLPASAELAAAPAPAKTSSSQKTAFDINAWVKQFGKQFDLKTWKTYNPSPHRSYFPKTADTSAEAQILNWTDEVGPLGFTSYMHDRTWDSIKSVSPRYPKALRDQTSVAFNAIEVLNVKPNAPTEGHLKKGDLILEIDGNRLLPAQHMFLDHEVTAKEGKGLRIHVGHLIDRAEGKGEITLKVVHLPDALRNAISKDVRKSTKLKTIPLTGEVTHFSTPLQGADTFIIHLKKAQAANLVLKSDTGTTLHLKPTIRAGKLTNASLECPQGNWTLEGDINNTSGKAKEATIEIFTKPTYPKSWEKYTRTETIKIPKIGSFGDTFDPTGTKAKNYATIMSYRLAVQQQPDGSWTANSYGSPVFQTAIAGLALLSQDDPQYAKNIKAAVDFICKDARADKWSYVNAMPPMFLAEYYLRTKDSSVLPYLRLWVNHVQGFVYSDYTSGHGKRMPGYGGSGYIGAGGAIACAFATASLTPITTEQDLFILDHMLIRAQEMAPSGLIPYGRGGGTEKNRTLTPGKGQGTSCGSGPYYAASRIRGGAKIFTDNSTYRYSHAPYGSAGHGHATQTMHFFWGMLSSAVASEKSHIDSMNDYLWKYTLYRDFDGTANKNNERTEYHNGDGVIGEPYWRMSSFIIHMNAHKRNLAITGKPEYQKMPHQEPMVFHADKSFYNEFIRNWSLAEYALGDQAPAVFKSTFDTLLNLTKDENFGKESRRIIKAEALNVAKSILSLEPLKGETSKEQIAALILGIYMDASCSPDMTSGIPTDGSVKETKKALKKRKKAFKKQLWEPEDWLIKINRSVRVIGASKGKGAKNGGGIQLFQIKDLTVTITDPTKKYLKKSITTKVKPLSTEKPKKNPTAMLEALRANPMAIIHINRKQKATIEVKVSYTVAGIPISYTVPMQVPAATGRGYIPNLTQVPVTGTVTSDFHEGFSPGILLDKTQRVVSCEISYAARRHYLLVGGKYQFKISPRSSVWAHDLRSAKPLTPDFRNVKISAIDGIKKEGLSSTELIQWLSDHREEKKMSVLPSEGQTLTFHFDEAQTISQIYVGIVKSPTAQKKDSMNVTFETKVNGSWKFMSYQTVAGMKDCIPFKTQSIRATFGKSEHPIAEINFITPSKSKPLNKETW